MKFPSLVEAVLARQAQEHEEKMRAFEYGPRRSFGGAKSKRGTPEHLARLERVRELHAEGMTDAEMGEALELATSVVWGLRRQCELAPNLNRRNREKYARAAALIKAGWKNTAIRRETRINHERLDKLRAEIDAKEAA